MYPIFIFLASASSVLCHFFSVKKYSKYVNQLCIIQLLGRFFPNNPQNLDLSYKMDLDFWDSFEKTKKKTPGPLYSKLTTSLVDISLKFQTLISEICHYFC